MPYIGPHWALPPNELVPKYLENMPVSGFSGFQNTQVKRCRTEKFNVEHGGARLQS